MDPVINQYLADNKIEDIVLSPRGISTRTSTGWTGPMAHEICQPARLTQISQRLAESMEIQLSILQPSCDTTLELTEGRFRIHIVMPPMCPDGPEITLRRISKSKSLPLDAFSKNPSLIKRLAMSVQEGASVLISGSTGSGKTTLMRALMSFIPDNQRVIILEDSPEIPLPNQLATKLLAKPNRFSTREGATWTLEQLVFECLRMRPDRIILGEVRGQEARSVAHALQTGHKGLMCTIHAASATEAQERFAKLAQQPPGSGHAWDLCLHVSLNKDGHREIRDALWTQDLKS